jgi:flavin-dependent dehydrogenase
MRISRRYDVVVVGGSVGGCTAATLYARRGLRIALVERSADPSSYKKVCTHFIQPAARPTLRKLGLDERIEAAGGVPNVLEVWTPWGWIRPADPGEVSHGYNIRRQTLDPLLRGMAAGTPGVDFLQASSARELLRDARARVSGVVIDGPAGRRELTAPLVVAADGRLSPLARLAGVAARQHENRRFTYFTYYRGLRLESGASSQYWLLGPDLAYAFRNDGDTTLLGIFRSTSELPAFKSAPLENFRRFWDRVPGGPRIGQVAPLTELRGITRLPNQWRPASAPGIAFVGDAAMVLDPIWGTGCGFAFLSADWLVEATLPAFAAARGTVPALDRGLENYRKLHRARTRGHYAHICSFSRVRPLSLVERLVFSAATRDAHLARLVFNYLGRTAGILSLLSPAVLLRAALVNGRHALFGPPVEVPDWKGQGIGAAALKRGCEGG